MYICMYVCMYVCKRMEKVVHSIFGNGALMKYLLIFGQ